MAIQAGARTATDDTYLNLLVNLAGIPAMSYLWKREVRIIFCLITEVL